MRKLLTLAVMLIVAVSAPSAFAKDKTPDVSEAYLEGAGAGNNGSANVRVTIVAKKADKVTDKQLAEAAVNAILFKGYDDATNTLSGTSTRHAPMAGSPAAKTQHSDFFTPFFANGDYMNYVQFVEHTRRVAKYGKQFKVSVQLTINTALLRQDLEKQGVIRGLNSGW